jgi:hypothetical protein
MGLQRMGTIAGGLLLFAGGCAEAQSVGVMPAMPAMPAMRATPAVSLAVPVMSGPLSLSPSPPVIDAGALGTWYVDGAFSALGLAQTNSGAGDRAAIADVSNAQIFVQKTEGLARFYVQLGAYALPALGQTYAHETDASSTPAKFFDPVPQAFIKIAPSENFSVQAGKLPSLIGNEYTFTFENMNIERGLLWNQEPAISRGIQANLIAGPVGLSLSVNDGYYANRYTWLSGSASWTIDPDNSLVFAAGANLGESARNTLATPIEQNNGAIYNLIYMYSHGPLMLWPYLQYGTVPAHPRIGITDGASLYGAAVLASYGLTPALSLGVRVEYEASTGAGNLLYGPASRATSLTITPTYTHGRWFARADMSAVAIMHGTQGDGLGVNGNRKSQLRGLLELGYAF